MTSATLTIPLPERLGRRMSIGPFEDPRDFLRFLLVLSAGVAPALLLGAWAWTPFLLAALLLTLVRSEEESLWTHVGHRVGFFLRRRASTSDLRGSRRHEVAGPRPSSRSSSPAGAAGWTLWEHDPSRITGRSSEELLQEALDLLRPLGNLPGEVCLARVPAPSDVRPFLPSRSSASSVESRLQEGYRRLLRDATEGRFQAKLVLALPDHRTSHGPSSTDLDPTEELVRLGWLRLAGTFRGGRIMTRPAFAPPISGHR